MSYSSEKIPSFKKLLSYYPKFYHDVLEMRAILETEGYFLDDAILKLNQIIDNNFIDTCDEATIVKLEKFFRIDANENSGWPERRSVVKMYYTGFGKISATKIKEAIFPFSETTAEVTFKPADTQKNNLLDITIPRGTKEYFTILEILKFLEKRVSAHIWRRVNVAYKEHHDLLFGIVSIFLKEITIVSENEDINLLSILCDENGVVLVDENFNILLD